MDSLKLGRAMLRHIVRQAYDAQVIQHGPQDAIWQARRAGAQFILDVEDQNAQADLNHQLEVYLSELHA